MVSFEKNAVVKVRGLRIQGELSHFTMQPSGLFIGLSYRENLLMSYLGDLNVNTKVG